VFGEGKGERGYNGGMVRMMETEVAGSGPEVFAPQTVPLMWAEGGKVLRVTGTRIPLDTIVAAYLDGETPEEIAHTYSTLRLADVYAVLSYYLNHREAVEAYLLERRKAAAALQENASRNTAESASVNGLPLVHLRQRLQERLKTV
jgi:uncharacterized protein (DUF433 family)